MLHKSKIRCFSKIIFIIVNQYKVNNATAYTCYTAICGICLLGIVMEFYQFELSGIISKSLEFPDRNLPYRDIVTSTMKFGAQFRK